MTFWVLAGALALAAALAAAWPLLRRAPAETTETADDGGGDGAHDAAGAAPDLAVYRAQLAELEREPEPAGGAGAEADRAAARLEIQRRMLAADSAARAAPAARGLGRRNRRIAAALLALSVPAGALAVYSGTGSPGLPGRPHAERADVQVARARALFRAGEAGDAQAFERAVERALALDPDGPEALFYAGLIAAGRGDAAAARAYWRRVLARMGPDAPARAALERRIEALGGE